MTNRNELEAVLNIWAEIIKKTSENELSYKEATKYIYDLTCEQYKKNLPKEFCVFRLNHIRKKSLNGKLKEIKFNNINYVEENVVYVEGVEIYEKKQYTYNVKFIKEKDQWNFAAQFNFE